jgi:hypothetical protein
MTRALLLALLWPTAALAAPSLGMERVDEAGEPTGAVSAGETLDRGAWVRFVTETEAGLYLYLLQTTDRGTNVVWPATGDVWVSRAGTRPLVPRPPHHRDEAEPLPGWNGDTDGPATYSLIAAPSPRAVPADSWVRSLDEFLLGPPFLAGPAAAKAEVLATFEVSWGERSGPPSSPPDDPPPDDPSAD